VAAGSVAVSSVMLLCPAKFGSGSQMSRGFPSHKNVTFPTATNILTSPELGWGDGPIRVRWQLTSHIQEGAGEGNV
jgi:hypothetical protein